MFENALDSVWNLEEGFRGLVWRLYDLSVREPFRRLWMKGPWLNGFGFWNGRDPFYICSHLSAMSMESFYDRPGVCHALIDRNFEGFMVTCEFVMYVLLVAALLKLLFQVFMYRLFFVHHLRSQIQDSVLPVAEELRKFALLYERQRRPLELSGADHAASADPSDRKRVTL